jgi:branched-chain amino acid transport system permease protein
MQILLNGFISGLAIGLVSLAFTAVYLPTRVFHIALGGIYTVAPFVTWACLNVGLPWPIAAIGAILVGMILSLACDLLNHSRLDRRDASSTAHLVSSLGIYIICVQIVTMIWGNNSKVLRTGLESVVHAGVLILTHGQLGSLVTASILIASFALWTRTTETGLRFRGLADNTREMAIRGYNVAALRMLAFGVAGALASAASLAIAFDLGFTPNLGLSALLLAVVAMIIGGRHSFLGPVVGGVLLGIVRAEVVWYSSSRWEDAVTFLLLAVFLLVRPQGLLGRRQRLESE